MAIDWDRDEHDAERELGNTFSEVMRKRIGRRQLLKAGLVIGAATLAPPVLRSTVAHAGPGTAFDPIDPIPLGDEVVVPDGYRADVLIKWGDPIHPGVPAFDINAQTAALQEARFGFNCDYLMYFPLPLGSENANRALLWVNHEYTDGPMMFHDYDFANPTAEQVAIELAAHGGSVIEIRRRPDGRWDHVVDSAANRRVTATTPILISGPAAGDPMMQTDADPTGTLVLGMLNNCGGGITPWGTVLTAEENFNQYFANRSALADPAIAAVHARYGLPGGASERKWERFDPRFDLGVEPHEPFRFGWMVEIDPYDASWMPRKRTALGRFKHEAGAMTLSTEQRVVVYSGDDERFDYVYKFVSDGTLSDDRNANRELLDTGTLYAARFNDDGTGEWLPLTFGTGPLIAPAFVSQADVLIRTRQAGDALGATKMDRPEDIEVNPATGVVYVALTNNTNRGVGSNPGVDAANPRARNRWGHIIEIHEDGGDHARTTFRWEIFLLCGDPNDSSTYFAGFDKSQVSPIANPDNIAFDGDGNLWIATDGQPGTLGIGDAVYAVATTGPDRGHVKQFLAGVVGAEVASLCFNSNDTALFVSIQHPGEGGSLASPTSVWPDGPSGPARPSVIAVTRRKGGKITR